MPAASRDGRASSSRSRSWAPVYRGGRLRQRETDPLYLTDLFYDGAARNGSGHLSFQAPEGGLRKWTFLPAGAPATEILRLAALACAGKAFQLHLGPGAERCRAPGAELRLEVVAVLHAPRDGLDAFPPRVGAGVTISTAGAVRPLRKPDFRFLPPPSEAPRRTVAVSTGNKPWFFVGYGPGYAVRRGGDRFDFSDPLFRLARFRSLFRRGTPLTDPVAFLEFLHHKAWGLSRYPAVQALERLAGAVGTFLGEDSSQWNGETFDPARVWTELSPWAQRAFAPVLDAARHAFDASPLQPQPFDIPGLVLLDRPDRFVPQSALPRWMALVDALFPHAQVTASVGPGARGTAPEAVLSRRLSIPAVHVVTRRTHGRPRVPPGAVVLAQVDGSLPNLALMKLGRYFREQGRPVVLARGDRLPARAEAVFASAIFTSDSTRRRLGVLGERYGDALVVGGSGVDVARRLAPEAEALPADFSLYPELGDRALGFLTRGCPYHCPFCLVPRKEGPPRQASDFDTLLQGRKRLILLDDNLLAHPQADAFLEEMVRRGLEVNFNQTLDLRLVNRERASVLRRLRCRNTRFTRPAYHFSLNGAQGLDQVRQRYELFGFRPRENVEFVCMYGFDTTLAEDVARFRFLRSLPGAYVFVQEYRPVPGGPTPRVPDFFGPDPDRLLRELVSICFPQNMKSMEKYYRWLSRRYALAYGRLNSDLVETIFRYNQRWQKGLYLATLAGTIPKAEALTRPERRS